MLLFIALVTALVQVLSRLPLEKIILRYFLGHTPGGVAAEAKRKELVALQGEINGVSAKDEFARHARLQRRILALERTLKSAVAETHKAQQTATRQINLVLKGVIILARMLLVIFYRASIVAHLPVGMTGPLAPLLAFPTGEGASGAISGLTWILLCNTAIALIC